MIKNIAMVTGLMLIAVDRLSAESILTEDQMDRITAGIIVSASDENAFFKAAAAAEGMTAEAFAEVGFDFALANGSGTTIAVESAEASASASVTTKEAVPQLLSSPSSQVRPSRLSTPIRTPIRRTTRVR